MKLFIRLLLAGLFLQSASLLSASPDTLLVLHSYHKADWSDSIMLGINSVFSNSNPIDIRVEYMDVKWMETTPYLNLLESILKMKYSGKKIGCIITSDDMAFHFALRHQKSLFSNAPIAFCGVNEFRAEMTNGHPRVSGVLEEGDFTDTLLSARTLFPRTAKILVITDNTETGIKNLALYRKASLLFPSLDSEILSAETLSSLKKRLAIKDPETIGFFISYWREPNGRQVTLSEMQDLLTHSSVPVFGRSEWLMGKGLIGGKCVIGFEQGRHAALMAKAYLHNPDNQSSIIPSPNRFIFDYKVYSKFGIARDKLPPEAIVINDPESLWGKFRTIGLMVILTIISLLFIIGTLILSILNRKKMIKALEESEAKFRLLAENAKDMIFRINLIERRFEYVSPAVKELFGFEPELFHQGAMDGILKSTENSKSLMAEAIEEILNNELEDSYEYQIMDKQGQAKWLMFKLHVIRNQMNTPLYLEGIASDITTLKNYQENLIIQKEKAVEADLIKGRFLSNMSHEIRNPLNGVIGTIHRLSATKLNQEQAEYIKALEISGQQLLSIINDILDLSRIESGRIKPETTPFQLKVKVEEAFEVMRYALEEKLLSGECRIEPDVPHYFLGDSRLLMRVLYNLLSNAIKFTEYGRVKVLVKLNPENPAVGFVLEVSDTGIGIPLEEQTRIFEPFTQLDSTYDKLHQGTGLGLSLVKRFMDIIHGSITIESTPGVGSTFRAFFPYEPSTTGKAETFVKAADRPVKSGQFKILIAEDNAINRMLLEALLIDKGFIVKCAQDGLEALRQTEIERPDLLIVDIQMPGLNGMNLTKELRARKDELAHIPIIAVTGYSQEKDIEMILSSGVNSIIPKPIEDKDLLQKIAELLKD